MKDKYDERITILVSEEIKKIWQKFIEDYKISSISKLIRDAVFFYIDLKSKGSSMKSISELSHDLKEPLTAIKGYSHLLFENYKDNLNWDMTLKIKYILDQSLILEKIIKKNLDYINIETTSYDILIIDDDMVTVNLLVDFFELKGYTCKAIMLGSETFEELHKNTPKIILLDIILPDLNGYQICEEIKSSNEYKEIPIFYITAVPENEVSSKLKETGADGFFPKPFDFLKFDKIFTYL